MREKYESLALVQLKELAKVRGIKGVSTMKKAEVVEAMLAEDEKDRAREETARAEKTAEKAEPVKAENLFPTPKGHTIIKCEEPALNGVFPVLVHPI